MLWALAIREKGREQDSRRRVQPVSGSNGPGCPLLRTCVVPRRRGSAEISAFVVRLSRVAAAAAKSDSTEGPRPPGQDIPALLILKSFNLKGRS
jgi:hypothetical protein